MLLSKRRIRRLVPMLDALESRQLMDAAPGTYANWQGSNPGNYMPGGATSLTVAPGAQMSVYVHMPNNDGTGNNYTGFVQWSASFSATTQGSYSWPNPSARNGSTIDTASNWYQAANTVTSGSPDPNYYDTGGGYATQFGRPLMAATRCR